MRSRVVAVGGMVALAVGVARVVGRMRRRRPAVEKVAQELRTPLLYLLPEAPSGRPPRRSPWLERLANRAIARRGAHPQTFAAGDDAPGQPGLGGFVYRPAGRPAGAVLWIHGGGMITGFAAINHTAATRMARELGLVVATLDYRLAPERPFPAALDDCMTALRWLHDNAARLGVDPARSGPTRRPRVART